MPSIHIFGALVLHIAAEDEVRALPPSSRIKYSDDNIVRTQKSESEREKESKGALCALSSI